MTQPALGRGRLLRPTLVMIYAGVGLFMIVLGIVGWTLYDSRQAARHQAEQEAGNLALGLERDVGRAIDTLDLSIQAAAQGMMLPGMTDMEPAIRQAILFDGAIEAKGFGGVFIADEKGQVIYDSLGPVPRRIAIPDRAYFQVHQQQDHLGLVVSPPLQSRNDGEWTLDLSRRINHPDGSFAGVIVGELRLSYFYGLFTPLSVGPHGGVALFSTSGRIVARWPYAARDAGLDVSQGAVFRRMLHAPSGAFETAASIDNITRIYAYRRVGSLPLILSVGLATEDVFAEWNQKSLIFGAALLVLCGLGAGLGWAVRKELERQHTAALARLNALFSNSADAMFVACVHPDGSFTYEDVNPVWEEMADLSAAAAVGRGPRECWPPAVADAVLAGWRACIGERRTARYAFALEQSGTPRDWEVFVAPVLGEHGQVRRLIGVARDSTERNQLESKLRESQRLEAVGQLTAGIAHDFNNLLQAILGSIEVLHGQVALDAEGRECVEVAEDAARRCASLVHRLLAFSRQQALAPAPLQPASVFGNAAVLLTRTLGNRIRVEIDVDEYCWPVLADGAQLEDCLGNLALNARDAMPNGGTLRLHVGNVPSEAAVAAGLPAGDYVRFTMADEGAGMSPDLASRALEPFFTTKAIGKGTGLGLSMVQGFARQSGGDVRIDSVVGRGTTVTLWLPRAVDTAAAALPAHSPGRRDQGSRRVLVVDDEAAVRQTLSLFLTKAGLTPLAVESGKEALDLLQAGEACDLLVTDQSMPEMSGSELIEQTTKLRPELPVMLITGYDRVSGATGTSDQVTVLRKPFERAAFLREVRALLGAPADGPSS